MRIESTLLRINDAPTMIERLDREAFLLINRHLSDAAATDSLLDRIHHLACFHSQHLECLHPLEGDVLLRSCRGNRDDCGLIHDIGNEGSDSFRATFGPYQTFYYDLQLRCGASFLSPVGGFTDATADVPGTPPLMVGYSWRPVHIFLHAYTVETAMFFIPVKVWQTAP